MLYFLQDFSRLKVANPVLLYFLQDFRRLGSFESWIVVFSAGFLHFGRIHPSIVVICARFLEFHSFCSASRPAQITYNLTFPYLAYLKTFRTHSYLTFLHLASLKPIQTPSHSISLKPLQTHSYLTLPPHIPALSLPQAHPNALPPHIPTLSLPQFLSKVPLLPGISKRLSPCLIPPTLHRPPQSPTANL